MYFFFHFSIKTNLVFLLSYSSSVHQIHLESNNFLYEGINFTDFYAPRN